ncbi:MAG TPA: glycosyltransferase [Actinobacteria bacterium]|nr:glycosyltransferase [Actinomycetota bacterium]
MNDRRRVLVASSVHPPDDPRIRWKLIESLRSDFDVVYATQGIPSQPMGFEVEVLRGGRIRRTLAVWWRLLRGRFDMASIHDPELLPGAIAARLLGRTIVFDMHEDVVSQIRTKPTIPRFLRPLVAGGVGWIVAVSERLMAFTLAEDGYHRAVRKPHPVFANFLPRITLDPRKPTEESGVVYLGDITEARGAVVLVDALEGTGLSLHLVGRCGDELAERLRLQADLADVDLTLHGFVPHADALALIAHHHVGVSPLLDVANYRDSLPTKLLEYAAIGLPVVASDLPGTRAIAEDLVGVGLVTPGDVAALRETIQAVIGDAPLRAAVANDVLRVRNEYQWPDAEVAAFYASLGR